ncbi:hypothetical protein V6N13_042271 [Hibiscus sabdariffa]
MAQNGPLEFAAAAPMFPSVRNTLLDNLLSLHHLRQECWNYKQRACLKMREEFGLKQGPCHDFFVHCFCHYCALCQEYRELENQGFDLKLGWDENAERMQNRGVTLAPATEGEMKR